MPVLPLLRVAATAARLRLRPWTTNDRGRRLYLDPRDHRAWQLARHRGALDADAVEVWRRLVRLAAPDLVVDVGANYGEVALAADYPGASVHLVEANPVVAARLRRSLAASGLAATLHEVAASSASGTATLRLDRRSSGLSSLEPGRTDGAVQVPTRTVDELVGTGAARVLFKVDVEGHEAAVLAGMSRTLTGTRWWGLVENLGAEQAVAPHVYAVRRDGTLEPVQGADLVRVRDPRRYGKDLVLASHPVDVAAFAAGGPLPG